MLIIYVQIEGELAHDIFVCVQAVYTIKDSVISFLLYMYYRIPLQLHMIYVVCCMVYIYNGLKYAS